MFVGRYYHQLESSGRISLPKAFRGESATWIVTRGFDGGIFIFTEADFKKNIEMSSTRSFTSKTQRQFWRLIANDAVVVEPDSLGRIQLPEYLIQAAALKKEIIVTGSVEYIEVWDRDIYHSFRDELNTQAEDIAEQLNHDGLQKDGR